MSLGRALDRFFRHDAAGGVVLMAAAVLALMVANSGLSASYHDLLVKKFSVLLDGEGLSKPLILWINDGLMAIFFFLIGLELKREMLEGKLKNPRDVILPGMAAVGGMVVPALIYVAFNWSDPILGAAGRSRRQPTSPSPSACSRFSANARLPRSRSSC